MEMDISICKHTQIFVMSTNYISHLASNNGHDHLLTTLKSSTYRRKKTNVFGLNDKFTNIGCEIKTPNKIKKRESIRTRSANQAKRRSGVCLLSSEFQNESNTIQIPNLVVDTPYFPVNHHHQKLLEQPAGTSTPACSIKKLKKSNVSKTDRTPSNVTKQVQTQRYMLPTWKRNEDTNKQYSKQDTAMMRDVHLQHIRQDNHSIYKYLRPGTSTSHSYKRTLKSSGKMHKQPLKLRKIKRKKPKTAPGKSRTKKVRRKKTVSKQSDYILSFEKIAKKTKGTDEFLVEVNKQIQQNSEQEFEKIITTNFGTVENEYEFDKLSKSFHERELIKKQQDVVVEGRINTLIDAQDLATVMREVVLLRIQQHKTPWLPTNHRRSAYVIKRAVSALKKHEYYGKEREISQSGFARMYQQRDRYDVSKSHLCQNKSSPNKDWVKLINTSKVANKLKKRISGKNSLQAR